ncbi:TSUP family transporter [Pseudactinotalea sp. HY158]|uniref:TSUP family transporter n=1 Tax=Pseudactinotalea sp. HY158 TaxID=2654547 RepID=UPI00129C680D|nr:TSUP family transporter [Pseudactinotalea sp. HY158]QGH70775.1 TSUP family transporter [Pseudactinotalea sp. HY158]
MSLVAHLPELSALAWAALVLAAVATGVSKAAVPAVGAIGVVLAAAVIPARESTGTMLVLFLLGDVFALTAYGRHAHWSMLARMAPNVVLGMVLGFAFLAVADDQGTAIAIGLILLALMGLGLVQRAAQQRAGRASADEAIAAERRGAVGTGRMDDAGSGPRGASPAVSAGDAGSAGSASEAGGPEGTASGAEGGEPAGASAVVRRRRLSAVIYGSAGGFTSMVANAGGPVMSMYFLVMRLGARTFLGTAAWFFAVTNLMKLPFSVGLGLISWPHVLLSVVLVPALAAGFFLGRFVITRIAQGAFERVIVVATLLGAGYLVVQGFAGL